MITLMLHNHYQQPGGEDQVFAAEAALLEAHGHRVRRLTVHNEALSRMTALAAARAAVWSSATYRQLVGLLSALHPAVIHCHNTFPLISPSAYAAARDSNVPVVQTLHNYRLLCVNALLFREGRVCEDCVGRLPWLGVLHACYRQSRAVSAAVATMLTVHWLLGTWATQVDVYVALTEFARQKLIAGGLPAEKVVVKPNFVHPDPGPGRGQGKYALFVGRLAPEKGLTTLLAAWERLGGAIPLKIVGDGPEAPTVARAAQRLPAVEWLGPALPEDVLALMDDAAFLVMPSRWYEGFPRVIVEAFAKGTPVVASDLGAMAELVEPGRTGRRFRPGDPDDLAATVEWLWTHPKELAAMRQEARAEFEAKYTAERNYQMLMEIYQLAIGRARDQGRQV